MAYTVLARRYRSATFDEVIGQNHIAQTLKRAIESDRIAHAYLFCGTRGVGKTSMARIMAKALNCENAPAPTPAPCLKCNSCLAIARGDDVDVIEIDAASNTGVENIRELIESSQYRPARSRFKIYIIDEVHMLSKNAFNALLKTLEEPPSHVKFILATTEPEKVLPTILSRCQRYDFRNIPSREIAGHLKAICNDEHINASDDALLMVAKTGAGSMRDSLSLLDRLLSIGEKELNLDSIEQLLGLPKSQVIFDLAQAIGEGQVKDVLQQADKIINDGMAVDSLLSALSDHLRNLLVLRTCGPDSQLVEIPGLSMDALTQQAQRFDPLSMTQDITILEELRRQLRTTQAGRPLLDATLVRLALADQFTQISDLLSQVNTGPTTPTQKKKPDLTPPTPTNARTTIAATFRAPPPSTTLPPSPHALSPSPSTLGEGRGEGSACPTSTTPTPPTVSPSPSTLVEGRGEGQTAPISNTPTPPTLSPSPSTLGEGRHEGLPPSVLSLDFDDDTDDDLPAPGKVWEAPAISLGQLMKQHAASSPPPPPPPTTASEPSIQPVEEHDIARIWPALLGALDGQGAGLKSVLQMAALVGFHDGQAIIRFPASGDAFARAWAKNGKRDTIVRVLSTLLGKDIGVKFEVEGAEHATPTPAPPTPQPTNSPAPQPTAPLRTRPTLPPAPAPPPAARPTPEQITKLSQDPLIAAILDQLDGQILRISEA